MQRGRLTPLALLAGCVWLCSYPLAYPSPYDGRPSRVRFRLPVDGEWTVRWGGTRREENPLLFFPDRCFGYHLVLLADDPADPPSAGAVGTPVHAPAAGEVVLVSDGDPGEDTTDRSLGSHLVLRVADDEFCVLGNLMPGSIRVTVGSRVEQGELLAELGTSADTPLTPLPHLPIHLQNTPEPGLGEGIPLRFHDVLIDGVPVDMGVPRGGLAQGRHMGQRVQNAP